MRPEILVLLVERSFPDAEKVQKQFHGYIDNCCGKVRKCHYLKFEILFSHLLISLNACIRRYIDEKNSLFRPLKDLKSYSQTHFRNASSVYNKQLNKGNLRERISAMAIQYSNLHKCLRRIFSLVEENLKKRIWSSHSASDQDHHDMMDWSFVKGQSIYKI